MQAVNLSLLSLCIPSRPAVILRLICKQDLTMMQKYLGFAIVLALLAGCGNKGPLTLPDQSQPKQEQAK